jgi:hypothetical protein
MVGVAVINASQPYCRTGFMQALYVAFSTDYELPHLVPASLFRILFSFGFSAVFFAWFLHVSFQSRCISKYLASSVSTVGLLFIFSS